VSLTGRAPGQAGPCRASWASAGDRRGAPPRSGSGRPGRAPSPARTRLASPSPSSVALKGVSAIRLSRSSRTRRRAPVWSSVECPSGRPHGRPPGGSPVAPAAPARAFGRTLPTHATSAVCRKSVDGCAPGATGHRALRPMTRAAVRGRSGRRHGRAAGRLARGTRGARPRLGARSSDSHHWALSDAAGGAGQRGAKESRKTTRLAAREAGGDHSSAWSLTVTPFPRPPSSRRDRRTNRPSSSR